MKKRYIGVSAIIIGLFLLIFLANGFGQLSPTIPEIPTPDTLKEEKAEQLARNTWQDIGDGIERMGYLDKAKASFRAVLYRFPMDSYEFSFSHSDEPKTLREWHDAQPAASLIANGVYFHEDFLPSGFLLANGNRIGNRSFDIDKSNYIYIHRDGLDILPKNEQFIDYLGEKNIAQSYPLLIENGKAAISSDSGLVARRTFLGVDEDYVYVGVSTDSLVSLYELAQELEAMPIAFTSVINLDGGPSSGMSIKNDDFEEVIDAFSVIPNVFVITPK